ncbi:IclR family transcriptional regulator [Brachybacterium sp. Z12]|uniref:IclR family transcriptional regulator n=1 Tax=Brachybacterium sp. Z12 TaxID=2759167 RepID=UPI00223AB8B9|nr:IclR family transcriptional regulator C-terminal domain-containing protein [Brachybacterium sp. Z12]
MGIAKSSASNICAALERERMIHRAGGGYRLGLRTAELGGAFAAQFNQVREFFEVVEEHPVLSRQVVQIATLDSPNALYLARHEGRRHRLGTPLGSRLPLIYCAVGNAMLMPMPDEEIQPLVLEQVKAPRTERSTRSPEVFWESLRTARDQGFAVDPGSPSRASTGSRRRCPRGSPEIPIWRSVLRCRRTRRTPRPSPLSGGLWSTWPTG